MLPKANNRLHHTLSRRYLLQNGATGAVIAAWLLKGYMSRTAATSTPATGQSPQPTATPTISTTTATLRVVLPTFPDTLDPAFFGTTEAFQFGFMVYDGLLWVDHTLTPQPMLAKTWRHSEDLLTWTFSLRQDVTFHHGAPFTAEDVVYTFTR